MHSTTQRPNKQLKKDYIDVVGDAAVDACWVPPLLQSQQHHPQVTNKQTNKKNYHFVLFHRTHDHFSDFLMLFMLD